MFFRNSPELPPSSATVTMAAISTSFLRKLSKITEIPVPPPITAILGFLMNGLPFPFYGLYLDETNEQSNH